MGEIFVICSLIDLNNVSPENVGKFIQIIQYESENRRFLGEMRDCKHVVN